MGSLARSENTPGLDAALDLFTRVAVDPDMDDRYPNGTVFIAVDSPHTSKFIANAIADRKPIALVFPDGSDVLARPPKMKGPALALAHALGWLVDRASKKRDRPTFVPREWITEFHKAPAGAERQMAGSVRFQVSDEELTLPTGEAWKVERA